MGDVEEARGRAHMRVLLDDALLVLQRHLPAGVRHHLGAVAHVQVIERRALERAGGSLWGEIK